MKRFLFGFASTRLAFALIALLIVHMVAAAIIPQQTLDSTLSLDHVEREFPAQPIIEKLHLDRIYTAVPFHVLLGLLALNLAAGNVRRFRSVYKVEKSLLKLRHLGSIIFHLGLLSVLLGALFNYGYKFHGVFALTEGQSAADTPMGFFRTFEGPFTRPSYGTYRLTMKSLSEERDAAGEKVQRAGVELMVLGRAPREEVIGFGSPIEWDNVELHLGKRLGYSPELVVADSSGTVLFQSFVRLAAAEHDGEDVHSDFVQISEETTVRLEIEQSDAQIPGIWMAVERHGVREFEGFVSKDDVIEVEELRLQIPRLRRWAFLEARTNPGLVYVFAGFWTVLVGLSLTLASRMAPKKRKHV